MLLKAKDLSAFDGHSYSTSDVSIRVLLIFPPTTRAVKAMWTIHNETENSSIGAKPPLGIMYVGSYLKNNSCHTVRLIDCQVEHRTDDEVKDAISDYQPHLVGISVWTEYWYDAWKCIQITKEINPTIHVNLGGPHIGVYPEISLQESGCDSVIVGDGEIPFLWLANGISNGNIPDDLPGLHTRAYGVKQGDRKFFVHGELDKLNPPIREMLPYKKYSDVISSSDYVTTMITSRGCPFLCTFCKLTFQKTLSHSAEYVIEEFQRISDMGIRSVQVYDDTFTWSKKRLIAICEGIIERGIKINWAIRDRVSSPTPETMKLLALAGCSRIHYGVESGSNKTLRTIKKNITTEQAVFAFRLAKSQRIQTLAYFMIGLPGETIDDMRETIRFAKELDPDYATFSVMVPYAGTEIYTQALKSAVIPEDYWIEFAKAPRPNFVLPYFWEEHLNKEELLKLRDEGTRQFYFRTRYIFRELKKLRNWKELTRKATMALNVFQTSIGGTGHNVYLNSKNNESPSERFANNNSNPNSWRD